MKLSQKLQSLEKKKKTDFIQNMKVIDQNMHVIVEKYKSYGLKTVKSVRYCPKKVQIIDKEMKAID